MTRHDTGRRRACRCLLLLLWASMIPSAPARACQDAPECALPVAGALPTGPVTTLQDGRATTTGDQTYMPGWAGSSTYIGLLTAGLELEACDWDDGWGWNAVGDLNRPLSRLLNAAYLVFSVQQYSQHPGLGLWRPVAAVPETAYQRGRWWDFVANWGEDEWEPTCEDTLRCTSARSDCESNADCPAGSSCIPSVVASYNQGTDEYYNMRPLGSYRVDVLARSSTVIHETAHEEVSHIDSDDCAIPSGSCDEAYGVFGANTMQLNYLHDMLLRYEVTTVGPTWVRQVWKSGDLCGYIPWFATAERDGIVALGRGLQMRYAEPSGAIVAQGLAEVRRLGETWLCQTCDPADYRFDAGLPHDCAQRGCNELLNTTNAIINVANRSACNAYNDAISSAGSSPATVTEARALLDGAVQTCVPVDESNARTYCDQEIAAAATVDDVDPCGYLDPVHLPSVSKLGCVQEFCRARFLDDRELGRTGWWSPAGDPYGCLDYVCGPDAESCGGDLDRTACATQFIAAHGDPRWYLASCETDHCQRGLVECVAAALANDPNAWELGDELPAQCGQAELAYVHCRVLSRLATMILVNLEPFVDPGPLRSVREDLIRTSPGRNLYRFVDQIREVASSGPGTEAAVEAMVLELAGSPEMMAELFRVAPGPFVALFGNEGFEEVLGLRPQRLGEGAIDGTSLTPAAQTALVAFEAELAGTPADMIGSVFGTVKMPPIVTGGLATSPP